MEFEKFLLYLNIAIYSIDVIFLVPVLLLYLIGSNEDWYSGLKWNIIIDFDIKIQCITETYSQFKLLFNLNYILNIEIITR